MEKLERYLADNSIHYIMESNSKHFFVTNNTKGSVAPSMCDVIIPLDGNFVCRIPATKLPVDLTDQVPMDKLLESNHLRTCLTKRYILLCPEEEAFKKLDTKEARIEMEKLRLNTVNLNEMYKPQDIEVLETKQVETVNKPITVNLKLMETLHAEDFTDDEKLVTVQNMAEELKTEDWEYCLEHGTDAIKELATKNL